MTSSLAASPAILTSVAERALAELPEGCRRIGLGTGRAAEAFIVLLGKRAKEGLEVEGVPTSERSDKLAREHGIRISTLAEGPLDVAFDGADEVDASGQLTKGLGGAMLRERVVAAEARRFIVLVTAEKIVAALGMKSPLPVEVVPFALDSARRRLADLASRVELRAAKDGSGPFVTDNHNWVLDLHADGGWDAPRDLDARVRRVPGVVDTGFFFDMASLVVIGSAEGTTTLAPGR